MDASTIEARELRVNRIVTPNGKYFAKKSVFTITLDGIETCYQFEHGLKTADMIVQFYSVEGGQLTGVETHYEVDDFYITIISHYVGTLRVVAIG